MSTTLTRAISFCFDDGFRGSARTVHDVFSRRDLHACFAVLARPERALDPYVHGADLGDWGFWREMAAAGHEVASHGLIHERYDELGLARTQAGVQDALRIMEAELPGFERGRSLFHVPYLSAPQAVVEWLGTQCLGVRLAGPGRGLNRWADMRPGGRVDSLCHGPRGVAAALRARLREFAAQDGWLVLVMHGVDGEGWGPVDRSELEGLLDEAAATGAEIITPDRLLARVLPKNG
jgi:peptidoglycan/xylan/chitin deacetylase (PgdA/CDA1 family)